jgi:hypothetical protein
MGNIAATAAEDAAAAAATAAGNRGAPSDEEKAAGDQGVEQWFSEEYSSSPNDADNDEDKTQKPASDEEKDVGDQGAAQANKDSESPPASEYVPSEE